MSFFSCRRAKIQFLTVEPPPVRVAIKVAIDPPKLFRNRDPITSEA